MVIRISFGLLIATSLALTVYFGATAWRLCNDQPDGNAGQSLAFQVVRSP
jgi:hypothetical protein